MKYLTFFLLLIFSTILNASILCDEITLDPLGRGYSTMEPDAIRIDLETEYRLSIKASMTGTEIFQAVDPTELLDISAVAYDSQLSNAENIMAQLQAIADRVLIMSFFTWERINPAGNEATIFASIFGGGSATITALILARQELISRAEELGLGTILPVDIVACQA